MAHEDDFNGAIDYVRWCIGRRKHEIAAERLRDALITSFRIGYSGNHQPFPANSLRLFRGRVAAGEAQYQSVSELWYPKSVKRPSRATFADSVFYCSYGNATALLELRPDVSTGVCIMECVSVKDLLKLKWITPDGAFNLQQLRDPYGSFERLETSEELDDLVTCRFGLSRRTNVRLIFDCFLRV
jgi:hypothetical protein